MIPFGKWVELHRITLGLTQAELARKAGLDRQTVFCVEREQHGVHLSRALKIIEEGMGLRPWEAFLLMERANAEDYRPDEV